MIDLRIYLLNPLLERREREQLLDAVQHFALGYFSRDEYINEFAYNYGEWTRDLAATLGVRVRRISPTELAHSNTLTLLDGDGRVVRQQTGFESTDETIAAALGLTTEQGGR